MNCGTLVWCGGRRSSSDVWSIARYFNLIMNTVFFKLSLCVVFRWDFFAIVVELRGVRCQSSRQDELTRYTKLIYWCGNWSYRVHSHMSMWQGKKKHSASSALLCRRRRRKFTRHSEHCFCVCQNRINWFTMVIFYDYFMNNGNERECVSAGERKKHRWRCAPTATSTQREIRKQTIPTTK